jgi:hypothetical protein
VYRATGNIYTGCIASLILTDLSVLQLKILINL